MATEHLTETFFQLNIVDEDHELIESLISLAQKSPRLVRSTEYEAPADSRIKIRSWKMNEFKYYDIPSPFPTLARGLFTQDVEVERAVKHRIVARGYDKFFNIGEVPWTTVSTAVLSAARDMTHHLTSLVGLARSAYKATVHAHAEVERMHHLHRGAHAFETHRDLQTCCGQQAWWCRRRREPCSSRRAVAEESSRRCRQVREAARACALGQQVDCGCRGRRSSLTDSLPLTFCSTSFATTRSRNMSWHIRRS